MKKQTPETPKTKRISAAELIAKKAKRFNYVEAPPAAAIAELREVIAYNDVRSSSMDRVSRSDAIEMLRTHGWTGRNAETLDRLCQEVLDRKSYAQK